MNGKKAGTNMKWRDSFQGDPHRRRNHLSGILMFNFGGKINGSLFTKKRAGHSLIDKTSRAE
jgi:hypothetical protein